MNRPSASQDSNAAASKFRAAVGGLGAAGLALALASCSGHAPKGQVVAVVNGQEVTAQDLASEARATPNDHNQTAQTVLQRVIARVLLAQDAHTLKLDAYPGYPSDIARVQQTFLAEKTLQSVVKPPAKPTDTDVASFMAAHPYAFANRMQLQVDQVSFQSGDNMKSLGGADSLDALQVRLKTLSVPFKRGVRKLDTAEMPTPLAQKLVSLPAGQMFTVHEGDMAIALVIQGRQPVPVPPDQQKLMALQVMARVSTQQQVDTELKRLREQAKITYQPGYTPPTPRPTTSPVQPTSSNTITSG